MKKVIVTVGPSFFNSNPTSFLNSSDFIFRINGAHHNASTLEKEINKTRSIFRDAKILIDLPGNKIRTSNLEFPIELVKGKTMVINSNQTNFSDFHKHLKINDVIWASDSTLKLVIEKIDDSKITVLSESNGYLLNNKGLHVRGINIGLPFLFEKDFDIIKIANEKKVSYIGLSFVRNSDDIEIAKKILDSSISIMSKIETIAAVKNIDSILSTVDYIIVDRGDLSTEIGIEKVALYQKYIVDKGLFYNKKVFLATQFLKNMEEKPIPTIAEVIDLYHSLKMGIYGIQLSEETAIGKFPQECIKIIQTVMDQIKSEII